MGLPIPLTKIITSESLALSNVALQPGKLIAAFIDIIQLHTLHLLCTVLTRVDYRTSRIVFLNTCEGQTKECLHFLVWSHLVLRSISKFSDTFWYIWSSFHGDPVSVCFLFYIHCLSAVCKLWFSCIFTHHFQIFPLFLQIHS